MESSKPVKYILKKRIDLKSLIPPTLFENDFIGTLNKYHFSELGVPSASVTFTVLASVTYLVEASCPLSNGISYSK